MFTQNKLIRPNNIRNVKYRKQFLNMCVFATFETLAYENEIFAST